MPERIVPRDLAVPIDSGKIISIIGPRRAGKTFYQYSLISQLRKEHAPHSSVYLNFEDERLRLGTADLQLILDAYQQLYPDVRLEDVSFFFDEIQEVRGWELFLRRVLDTVSSRIFITGSSLKLLGREIATALRGRTLAYPLLPFSFDEYLRHYGIDGSDIHSTKNRNRIVAKFDRFLVQGGYPEVVDYDENLFVRTLQSYVDVMIFRDVIERHSLRNVHVVRDMARRLIINNAATFSVHKYYNDMRSRGIRVSKDTLYSLLDHLTDAYLVLPLNRFDPSVAKREQALKKFYVNDPGLTSAFVYTRSANLGSQLETMVFLELKKREVDVCYFADGGECDFLIEQQGNIIAALQVCYSLDEYNRKREIRGLLSALKRFELGEGLLLTHHQEEKFEIEGFKIDVTPAWKWALDGSFWEGVVLGGGG